MAENSSSSASTGKYTKLFKAGSIAGKASKAKKRRSRQKKEKATQMTTENVQIDESLLLSTAEHTERNSEHKELGQNSGESDEIFSQEMESEPVTELAPSLDVLEASTSKLEVAEGTSDSKDLKEPVLPTTDESEEGLAAAKRKELPNERANNDGEGKVIVADESLGQQTSSKKRMDLLSFGRSKKSKTQRAKSDPSKASGVSGSRIKKKSKSLGKENEQEPSDNRDAVKDMDNSPEDAKSVENNEGEMYVSERAQDVMNAAGSNKGKKFKPLAGLRRHKKKANSPKSASAEETNIEENKEVQEEPIQPASDEVFAEENGDKVSEEDEQTEPNEDVKKKSAGKKFGPLRSFRRSRPTKKSTEAEKDGGGEIKEHLEKSQESGDEEENHQDPDVQEPSAVTEDLSEECTGTDKENSELVPEEDEIQDETDTVDDADPETMSTTKKGKKKSLLRRRMKKIWSTNGKNKEASNTEKPAAESNAEENVADEGSEVQEQVKSQNPPNSPAEASSEESQESDEKVVTDREECELADSPVEEKSDEMNLEAAPIKLVEKTGLFGRQIKKVKVPIKKRKEENEDESNLTEMSPGASGADNKEITKQVKRKKSGFQKISNALKKKKSKDEGCQREDEIDMDQGPQEKEPQETDCQNVCAEVDVEGCQREDERDLDQGPREKEPQETDSQHVSAEVDAEGRSEAENVPQEEMEKVNDNEEVTESPRESSNEEELNETVERNENCQDASATVKAYKAYGNLMKPVMQELVTKMANRRAAEPVVEPEEDSELTKSSEFDDDHSLTEITSDSSPSFADTYNEDTVYEDPSNSETDKPQKQERKGDQDGKSSDDELSTKEADAVEESSEYVPSIPKAEREKNSADEGETNREELEREVTKSWGLNTSKGGETSDLSSSQAAPSKGQKEEWILVNHFEVSHELSHQLKVLAMDSFEGSAGCCSLM